MFLVDWAVKMRIRPPELETSICDAKYHVSLSTRSVLGKCVYLVTLAMSLFNLQDVCIAIGSIATLDLPMVVDLIGIYGLKGPYLCAALSSHSNPPPPPLVAATAAVCRKLFRPIFRGESVHANQVSQVIQLVVVLTQLDVAHEVTEANLVKVEEVEAEVNRLKEEVDRKKKREATQIRVYQICSEAYVSDPFRGVYNRSDQKLLRYRTERDFRLDKGTDKERKREKFVKEKDIEAHIYTKEDLRIQRSRLKHIKPVRQWIEEIQDHSYLEYTVQNAELVQSMFTYFGIKAY
ncbi:plasma membrane ATPase 1-like [Dorcoceras hygrometricum]|uniref:Plasma membrane ATPase 1-like n=1 Tax=Dorcoceras hygrometricum TaxID=472368 RepID=A0A2Z7D538_9LAMI|nr:plasma membrane ATPase 1-like [Dorcoceras hygrometricum]